MANIEEDFQKHYVPAKHLDTAYPVTKTSSFLTILGLLTSRIQLIDSDPYDKLSDLRLVSDAVQSH